VRYHSFMKNITVSVADEVYYRSRVRAAERRTSVSAVVRKALEEYSTEETEFERLRREERELIAGIRASGGGLDPGENLSREELYDRNAFR